MPDYNSVDYKKALRELNKNFPGASYDPSLEQHSNEQIKKKELHEKRVQNFAIFLAAPALIFLLFLGMSFLAGINFNLVNLIKAIVISFVPSIPLYIALK